MNESMRKESMIDPSFRESGNPEKDWIPGQARNNRLQKTLVDLWQLR